MTNWKDDVDYPEYYLVSDDGQIYSKRRKKLLSQQRCKKGYMKISTSLNTVKIHEKVHRMVAKSFIPNPDNKPFINHKDGNKANNHVSNLEWCTSSENIRHAYDTSLKKPMKGEDNPASKLTWEIVDFIRNNYKPRDKEFGGRPLSRKYGVDSSLIKRIIDNKAWVK